MVQFSDNAKKELNQFLGEGVHKVTILGVLPGTSENTGSEYFEFGIQNEDGIIGDVKVYWTEKSEQYSFNTIRDIFVHNAKPENKEKVRAMVDAVKDTDELLKLCQDNLEGKEAWYKVEKSGTQYTNQAGELKDSYNRNLYGYEPQMKNKSDEQILDDIKNGTPVDVSEIPFE